MNLKLQGWRLGQLFVWMIGLWIFIALVFAPELGLHAFWDILIPLAPILIVFTPGLWRNVCPISTVSLFNRHHGWSRQKRLSGKRQANLTTVGMILLLVLIPLRHTLFNTNGMATAVLLLILSVTAFVLGWLYDWKSAWCAGMCPVHQVEKLYGSRAGSSYLNAHCRSCSNCSIPCPDSTVKGFVNPAVNDSRGQKNGLFLCAGFPGFIWGWFQVPDYSEWNSMVQLGTVYLWPILGLMISLTTFFTLKKLLPGSSNQYLIPGFTALAVSVYYWYRIPALMGLGVYPGDGMLVDLHDSVPAYVPALITFLLGILFFWWFLKRPPEASWLIRPEYAKRTRS